MKKRFRIFKVKDAAGQPFSEERKFLGEHFPHSLEKEGNAWLYFDNEIDKMIKIANSEGVGVFEAVEVLVN